eukprot:1354905-Pyramimonas_sp.AAC.1
MPPPGAWQGSGCHETARPRGEQEQLCPCPCPCPCHGQQHHREEAVHCQFCGDGNVSTEVARASHYHTGGNPRARASPS